MHREHDPLVIDPPLVKGAVQPSSVDVNLGNKFEGWNRADPQGMWYQELGQPWSYTAEDPDWSYELEPGELLLGGLSQKVHIPADMCAQLSGKSSLGRLGLLIHVTAGFIDPGFRGRITLELCNVGSNPIRLHPGMKIGQLVFIRLTSPVLNPYGSEGLGSHYQDQADTTRSYLEAGN